MTNSASTYSVNGKQSLTAKLTKEQKDFILNRWIPAFAGKRQGEEFLQTITAHGSKFCCLGIACDILKDELHLRTVEMPEKFNSVQPFPATMSYDSERHYLPDEVVWFMGIDRLGTIMFDTDVKSVLARYMFLIGTNLINMDIPYKTTSLSKLNDAGFPFDVIADVLRIAVDKDLFIKPVPTPL